MALESADVGILCSRACAHRSLAQVDFLERGPWSRRVVVEQRALRDRLPDRPFDIALAQVAAALELFVETLEHAARLLAGTARTFDGDVVAALLRHDAEAPLDQREVLSVLPEQHGGKLVVFECEHGLRRGRLL